MSKTFYWEELLTEVAKRIPPQQFRAWLEPARFVQLTDRALVISAPTTFSRDWVNDHYRDIFRSSMDGLYGLQVELKVEVSDPRTDEEALDSSAFLTMPRPQLSTSSAKQGSNDEPDGRTAPTHAESPTPGSETRPPAQAAGPGERYLEILPLDRRYGETDTGDSPAPAPTAPVATVSVRDAAVQVIRTMGQPLDPKHTFDTFVVGASNQFAHAAARAVAEQPATQYNPLFLYSDAGLGKTHLLHAIGNFTLRANPRAKICYLSAEKFANDLIESIQHGKMSQFRERYRDSYDMLLMDDIQFIAGKDRTQEEFFHTFNALHSSRRQIVVTSDKFPKDIPGLEDRIRTRFEWGLIADIQPPEIETRIAILRAKAEIDDIFLPNDVALFLASNIKSNIRELEGALIRLGAQASLSGSEISLELAKQLLRNIIKEPPSSISVDTIQDAVSRHFSIKVSDLKSKERSRRVAMPRQIAMYLIRKYCNKSYPDIGILLGGKDHSTILHGVKTIASDIEKDPEIRRHVEDIQNSL